MGLNVPRVGRERLRCEGVVWESYSALAQPCIACWAHRLPNASRPPPVLLALFPPPSQYCRVVDGSRLISTIMDLNCGVCVCSRPRALLVSEVHALETNSVRLDAARRDSLLLTRIERGSRALPPSPFCFARCRQCSSYD